MASLTEKQKKVLAFLQEQSHDGIPPSVREICAGTGIPSTSTVHLCLKALEEEGYISRKQGLNRAIKLPGHESVSQIPLLGKVTAGHPILAVEEAEEFVPYSGGQYNPKELFALRVSGTSMIGAGILDGDVVVVRRTEAVDNGDIVVALIGDEATVKRIYVEQNHIRLQPENPSYTPIIVTECRVLGKVVSLLRYF